MIGAFFGTTFPHLFFQSYRELAPAPFWKPPATGGSSTSPPRSTSASRGPPFVNPNPHGGQKRAEGYVYVPRIYGFKVSERAKSGPRMQWLRLRPETPGELDLVDWRGRWIDEDDEYDDEEDDEQEDRPMEDFDPVCILFGFLINVIYTLYRMAEKMTMTMRRSQRKRRKKQRCLDRTCQQQPLYPPVLHERRPLPHATRQSLLLYCTPTRPLPRAR